MIFTHRRRTGNQGDRTFFDEQGNKGYHQYLVERDSAPGGALNPGQSYRTAQRSALYLLALRS